MDAAYTRTFMVFQIRLKLIKQIGEIHTPKELYNIVIIATGNNIFTRAGQLF